VALGRACHRISRSKLYSPCCRSTPWFCIFNRPPYANYYMVKNDVFEQNKVDQILAIIHAEQLSGKMPHNLDTQININREVCDEC